MPVPKLLAASGIFPPESGGPATYLRAILPALQDLGWQVRVLTYGDPQPHACAYPVTRIARRAYPLRRLHYGLAAGREMPWADLVYAQTIDLPLWGWRKGKRAIKIVGDQAWERCMRKAWIPPDLTIDEFQSYQGDARVRWQKRSRSRQVASTDAVIVPSRYLKRMVMAWGIDPAKVHVIHNALSPPERPTQSRAELRAELGWDDKPRLICVARLQTWKGIDHVIQAAADLEDLHLVIAGDGPDRGRLKRLADPLGGRARFTGQLPAREAQRYMAAADGLALYSGYEGFSHTLLECLHLGTPALASDVGGNAEIIQHGVNGLLAPYLDIPALRAGISELIARRDEFSANCPQSVAQFGLETMANETDRLLRSLLT